MFLELGQKHNFGNYLHGPYLNVTHYDLLNQITLFTFVIIYLCGLNVL